MTSVQPLTRNSWRDALYTSYQGMDPGVLGFTLGTGLGLVMSGVGDLQDPERRNPLGAAFLIFPPAMVLIGAIYVRRCVDPIHPSRTERLISNQDGSGTQERVQRVADPVLEPV